MDTESLGTLHTLKLDETSQRNTGCSSSKAQHLGSLFSVKGLQRSPPPHDRRVGASISVVLCRGPPFIDVDVRRPRYQQLQFLFVELEIKNELVVFVSNSS